ncbi:HPr family phosphocarrier protein [Erwinia mallotivora]|uniref:Phosphocarrier protein NPr n=1 Tax=Erwinia mallotivora TaxID=69222 RepID=A0A014LWG6_9GAMM|nr:HPr family phosphocarrier protein [Erwinia mallotivora]EXU73926.1 PTS sugar transporter [Erwinia mallotivora]
MVRENIRVVNSTGLHARPAATLIKTVKKYQSSVTLINNGKDTRLKGLMSVLGAGVKGHSEIEIICEGSDEQEAMQEIKGLFASGFGEKD